MDFCGVLSSSVQLGDSDGLEEGQPESQQTQAPSDIGDSSSFGASEENAAEMLRLAGAAASWVHRADGAAKQVTESARACTYYSSKQVL